MPTKHSEKAIKRAFKNAKGNAKDVARELKVSYNTALKYRKLLDTKEGKVADVKIKTSDELRPLPNGDATKAMTSAFYAAQHAYIAFRHFKTCIQNMKEGQV